MQFDGTLCLTSKFIYIQVIEIVSRDVIIGSHPLGYINMQMDNKRRKGKETKKKNRKRRRRGESQHFQGDQLEQQTSKHMEKLCIL
jgi:hypothetical protein